MQPHFATNQDGKYGSKRGTCHTMSRIDKHERFKFAFSSETHDAI